jgi:hypothetical protein
MHTQVPRSRMPSIPPTKTATDLHAASTRKAERGVSNEGEEQGVLRLQPHANEGRSSGEESRAQQGNRAGPSSKQEGHSSKQEGTLGPVETAQRAMSPGKRLPADRAPETAADASPPSRPPFPVGLSSSASPSPSTPPSPQPFSPMRSQQQAALQGGGNAPAPTFGGVPSSGPVRHGSPGHARQDKLGPVAGLSQRSHGQPVDRAVAKAAPPAVTQSFSPLRSQQLQHKGVATP